MSGPSLVVVAPFVEIVAPPAPVLAPVREGLPSLAGAPLQLAEAAQALPLAPVSSSAPFSAMSPPRASSLEVTEILFEAMHDLSLFESAVEGGSFCLVTALRVVPCLAGLVHLVDVEAREFVVVYARGPRADKLVLSRVARGDALLERAASGGRPVVLDYSATDAPPQSERHAFFGDPWSALIVPIVHGGRTLGFLELIDPIDGAPFGAAAESALSYIAERYAEFVAERGIVLKNVVAPPSSEMMSI